MKILVTADSFIDAAAFEHGLAPLRATHVVDLRQVDGGRLVASTRSERSLRETIGHPGEIIEWLDGHEVLVVHGAPVTSEVLDIASSLRLICCARGGPVNVDLAAARERGVLVTATPGKNAQAVVELTLALAICVARRVPEAHRHALESATLGESAFEGIGFSGFELGGRTLGIVGFGRIGRMMAGAARGLGMRIVATDPLLPESAFPPEVTRLGFEDLLTASDVVTVHARATDSNENMFDGRAFSAMPRGALFVNTARESLVDEDALQSALLSGHLGGAALDVIRPTETPGTHPLLGIRNVIVTPHIGGATTETIERGVGMIRLEIERFAAGQPLEWSL